MLRILMYRLAGAVPVLLLVTLSIFFMLRMAPGDAAATLAPEDATPAEISKLRAQWGLDQPVLVQFGLFVKSAVTFEFGDSYRYGTSISSLIADRLPATLELSIAALLIAVVIAVPLGIFGAMRRGRVADGAASIFAVAGVSAPSFWIGILLVMLFAERMDMLPSGGRLPMPSNLQLDTGFVILDSIVQGDWLSFTAGIRHLILPATTLALGMLGVIMRITRSSVIDVSQEEFVTTAVAKGLTRREVIRKHVMPNAALPILTIIGLEIGTLISGSIIVEVVFSWPGLGSLLYQSVTVRDIPLTTGIVVSYTFLFILVNLLVDTSYSLIDPRIRTSMSTKK
ncbi:ABC transporter permease subunit [Bordetella petrii]|nr:ABC transporter permease subunit [Bordetella petrii]